MIFVDSQAALRCKSWLVRECKESLRTFEPDCKILGNETANALARLGSLSEGDLIVGSDPPICRLYALIDGWTRGEEQRRWGNESGCHVSRCLWPAIDSVRTSWLLGFDKASLRLIIGFITGYCEIRSLTGIWNRFQPDYCRVCCEEEEEELETVERLLCNCLALGRLRLRTLGRGFF